MKKELTREELKAKAEKPGKISLLAHAFYGGKIGVAPKCWTREIEELHPLSVWYTPGVAKPCLAIKEDPMRVFEFTNKANRVWIISNGTRVLGLGDIGPEAGEPVMEGKALIFNLFGGIDAMSLSVKEKNPDKFIELVKNVTPSVGGINLEDIRQPDCFYILQKLQNELEIPIWHDDQQGTAAIVLAGVINALKFVGKKKEGVIFSQLGIGAAGYSVVRVLIKMGVPPGNIRVVDLVNGEPTLLTKEMDLEKLFPYRGEMLSGTNADRVKGGVPEALKGADVMISFTKPGPGVIKPEWIKQMTKDAIVFPCANPIPEIWPEEAKQAGAKIVATGRTDFPNMCNNSLIFPAVFRGVLDVMASKITTEMTVEASMAVAKYQQRKGLDEFHILPTMDDTDVFVEEAVAVGLKAIEQGVARKILTEDELRTKAKNTISRTQKIAEILMKKGIIKKFRPAPERSTVRD